MRYAFLAAFFAIRLVAMGQTQTLTVDKLVSFIQSSEKLISEGKMTDHQVAGFLGKVRLTERLDDRTIEQLQGAGTIGPQTLQALQALRDRTRDLAAAKPVAAEPRPLPPPPPSSEEQAAIIDEVRKYALGYSKSLPDFICTQVTRRYAAPAPGTRYGGRIDSEPSWQALDTLQIRLSYFEQKEDYKLILVNNTMTTQDYRTLGGATSTGDFGSMMKEIFEPATQARFEWDHWATLRGRRTLAFSYHVAQLRSQWHLNYDRRLDLVPAYHGLIYVDGETHEVTRVTLEAVDIPASFPVKKADTVLDYDYQDISGHNFLLPLKARTIMSADEYITRNDTEFRLYRKYATSSDIKFETETEIPPLPEEKTKETKDPKATRK